MNSNSPAPDTRTKLLETAFDLVRRRGFAATSVNDLCAAAGVTKGAFFHHFASKEALGVAAAEHWGATTSAFFAAAPYHAPADPLARLLAYVALRREMIAGDVAQWSCVAGTMAQETHAAHPAIREACGATVAGHAATLEADFAAAIEAYGAPEGVSAASLAIHTQVVIQGAFVVAKAMGDAAVARESLDHLARYLRLLFGLPAEPTSDNGGHS